MGFDYSFIVGKPQGGDRLNGNETLKNKHAQAIANLLGKREVEPVEVDFERGISSSKLSIGTFGETIILGGDDNYTHGCFHAAPLPKMIWLLSGLIPSSEILAVRVYDVANLYGYAYFVNKKLVRCRVGNEAEENSNVGKLLPEEEELAQDLEIAGRDESATGGEFALKITERFFSEPIGKFDGSALKMLCYP